MGILAGYALSKKANINYCTNNDTRDYAYEAYCDSIWDTDRDYYLDVLESTDEYQKYVEEHGSWWANTNGL